MGIKVTIGEEIMEGIRSGIAENAVELIKVLTGYAEREHLSDEEVFNRLIDAFDTLEEIHQILIGAGIVATDLDVGVRKLAQRLLDCRQYSLFRIEEQVAQMKRIAMLEAALQTVLLDLRIAQAQSGVIEKYERILTK